MWSCVPSRVVMVDDDADDFHLVRNHLRELYGSSCAVEWVNNFAVAKNEILKQDADVYLIDYLLDGKTGAELLQELQSYKLARPMIFLTAIEDRKIEGEIMANGAADFVSKSSLNSDCIKCLDRSIRYNIKRFRDLEKVKDAEKIRAEARAAQDTAALKTRVLAKINHELRTPLTAILGYISIGLEDAQTLEEKNRCLQVVERNSQHLLEIINDFLDLSKIEAGCGQFTKAKFDLTSAIEQVTELMRPGVEAKGLKFNLEGFCMPIEIESDRQHLRQILLNLISNATKFTKSGSISVKCKRHESSVEIAVSDTGIGISIEEQEKLFRPYYQLLARNSSQSHGTGLGLELSRQMASALGGRLDLANSAPGVGSTFVLTLPLAAGMSLAQDSKLKTCGPCFGEQSLFEGTGQCS